MNLKRLEGSPPIALLAATGRSRENVALWECAGVAYHYRTAAAEAPAQEKVLTSTGACMLTIRLPKSEWGKAWRAMIAIAPVRLIADDPIYEVQPAHLALLIARRFSYEMVPMHRRRTVKRRHGEAD
jgi:hypothetical protein